jgi:hypothetical protein
MMESERGHGLDAPTPNDWSLELPVSAAEGRAYTALAEAWSAVVDCVDESPVTMTDPERGARPKHDAQVLVASLQELVRQVADTRAHFFATRGSVIPHGEARPAPPPTLAQRLADSPMSHARPNA